MQVEIPILDIDNCPNPFPNFLKNHLHICAGNAGQDSCQVKEIIFISSKYMQSENVNFFIGR